MVLRREENRFHAVQNGYHLRRDPEGQLLASVGQRVNFGGAESGQLAKTLDEFGLGFPAGAHGRMLAKPPSPVKMRRDRPQPSWGGRLQPIGYTPPPRAR